jgi:hypothetical protein
MATHRQRRPTMSHLLQIRFNRAKGGPDEI